MKIKAIRNWAWARRTQNSPNPPTEETRQLMQRADAKVQGVDIVGTLFAHIKRKNELIKILRAQVKLLNELTLRRLRGHQDFRTYHRNFEKAVRDDFLAVCREDWYKKHPEREGTLMTDAEAADLIIATNVRVNALKSYARAITDMPF